jgi:hypothetical protein
MVSVYQIYCKNLVLLRQSKGSDFQNGEDLIFGVRLIVQFW